MAVIETKNLKKYFGKTHAVDGVDFEVNKGEIFGFLGPNGAGKTTTIRMMMDFIKPDQGEIKILGKDSQKDSVEIKKEVGYLAPLPRLYENLTGKEHIRLISSIRGGEKNAQELIKKFDFDENKKVRTLSSGNRQKLSLILALMDKPKVLILDELTTGLDPILQNAVYNTLLEYRDKGITIFLSSHNLPEVQRICDRAAIIREGKIVAVEEVRELKKKHIFNVNIVFDDKVEAGDFKMKGVEIKEKLDYSLHLVVKGDINTVLAKIAKYKVRDLEIGHAGLEEVFLEFYEDK